MKNKKAIRRLSLLLCMILTFTFMPMTAFAATSTEGEVTVTKQLVSDTPDEDGNYTIRLTVQGNPITENVTPNADVVLVIDCSGSMGEPIWSPRITTAKAAGRVFAQGILTEGSGNRMAVIGFSSRSHTYLHGWQGNPISVKTDLVNEISVINNAIDRMRADGGTDYTSALAEAYNILDSRTDKTRPGFVVFISDGAPGLHGESQNDPEWNGSLQIAQLKAAGITVYTLGIALGQEAADYLRSMATSNDHFINLSQDDLDSQLSEVLSNWATKINRIPAGTDAVLTDVINGQYFSYVSSEGGLVFNEDENSLTWSIGDIPAEETGITFKVRPLPGWTGTQDTNLSCEMTYTKPDGTLARAVAPSPQVTLLPVIPNTFELPVMKLWEDEDASLRPESVTVYLLANGTRVNELTLTPENDWMGTFTDLPINDATGTEITYTVEEEQIENYTPSHTPPYPSVPTIDEWGDKITPASESQYEIQGDIIVAKKGGDYYIWTLYELTPAEKELIIAAVNDADMPGLGKELTLSNTSFAYGVPASFEPLSITITEESDNADLLLKFGSTDIWSLFYEGFLGETEDNPYWIITNTFVPPEEPECVVEIHKYVENLPIEMLPDSFTFRILSGEEIVGEVTVNKYVGGYWYESGTITLPYGTYTIVELDATVSGYDLTTTMDLPDGVNSFTVFTPSYSIQVYNSYTPLPPVLSTGSLVVKKTVSGDGADYEKGFVFNVALSLDGEPLSGVFGNVEFVDGTAEFTLAHDEEFYISDIPAGAEYVVTESDNEGYTVTATHDTGTIEADTVHIVHFENYMAADITIYVQKVWVSDDPDCIPELVYVQLYRDGEAYGDVVTLDESSDWCYVWEGLDSDYAWTVDEADVPEGFTCSITNNENEWIITNTKDEEPPYTNDNPYVPLWIGLALLSAGGMILLSRKRIFIAR